MQVFPDVETLSRAAAAQVAQVIETHNRSGEFTMALAGGSTPRRLYQILAADYRKRLPWTDIRFFWSDERYVPPDSPQSNYRMALESLLSRVPIPPENIHMMSTFFDGPDEAAADYEEILRDEMGDDLPQFDLVLLGLGTDGHTASLFPGSPVLTEEKRWVAASYSPVEPTVRLTMTPPILKNARQLIYLVSGREKFDVMQTIMQDPERAALLYPAAMIAADSPAIWFLDRDAATGGKVGRGIL
jgi:6-phosphogluconolactonase